MRVLIPHEIYQKVMYWVRKSDKEVSGLGTLRVVGEDLLVTEAVLVPQVNGSAHTDIEPADAAKVAYDFHQRGLGAIRWWWHSHVNMSVFWSGQDKATMKLLSEHGWIAASVFNKKEEIRSAVSMGIPIPLLADELQTIILREVPSAEQIAAWDASYLANVKEQKWAPYTPGIGYASQGGGGTGSEAGTGRWGNLTPEMRQILADSDDEFWDAMERGHVITPPAVGAVRKGGRGARRKMPWTRDLPEAGAGTDADDTSIHDISDISSKLLGGGVE